MNLLQCHSGSLQYLIAHTPQTLLMGNLETYKLSEVRPSTSRCLPEKRPLGNITHNIPRGGLGPESSKVPPTDKNLLGNRFLGLEGAMKSSCSTIRWFAWFTMRASYHWWSTGATRCWALAEQSTSVLISSAYV